MKEELIMLNTIYKRKSVRTYTKENISEEQLNIILKAIDASPVGMKQYDTLHVTIITNKELLNKIETVTNKLFKREDYHPRIKNRKPASKALWLYA